MKPAIRQANVDDWTPRDLIQDLLDLCKWALCHNYYGPFVIVFGPKWEQILDYDYISHGPNTLLIRVKSMEPIKGVAICEKLGPWEVVIATPIED